MTDKEVAPRYVNLAEKALSSDDGIVSDGEIIAVVDTLMVQGIVNGEKIPRTQCVERDDGRRVYFFRDPRRRQQRDEGGSTL